MKILLLCGLLASIISLSIVEAQRRHRNVNGKIPSGTISVINAKPRNGTIIKKGHTVTLSCGTNMQWFFCVWRGPNGNKQCALQQNQESNPQNICEDDDGGNRITLKGSRTNCDIELKDVQVSDFGTWQCIVTDDVNFQTDKTKIALEVGQAANVKFSQNFGKDSTLIITEGDSVSITCEALGAHPAPQFSWEEPQDADVDVSAQPQINTYDKTTDIRHTIKYKANLKDNNGEIRCIATQLDRDGRTVLYEKTATVKLKVEKIVLPVDGPLTQKIGIISGVLLAVLFLILLSVFVIFAVCKRRRKRSRPPSSTGTEDTSPEEPPIKPIWTTPMNNGQGGPPIIRQQVQQHQKSQRSHHNHHHSSNQQQQHNLMNMSNTVSQVTVSTQSTGSNASWEDRSVGGEIEEVGAQRYQKISPSIHETHFEEDIDLPTTVLHHPDPLYSQSYSQSRPQRPSYAGRPSSSMLEQHPGYNQNRPQSAMEQGYTGYPNTHVYYPTRRIPTPNGPMNTSVKSVFDCDLGCFTEDGEHDGGHCGGGENTELNISSPTSPLSEASRTSEPRDV